MAVKSRSCESPVPSLLTYDSMFYIDEHVLAQNMQEMFATGQSINQHVNENRTTCNYDLNKHSVR